MFFVCLGVLGGVFLRMGFWVFFCCLFGLVLGFLALLSFQIGF